MRHCLHTNCSTNNPRTIRYLRYKRQETGTCRVAVSIPRHYVNKCMCRYIVLEKTN